MNRRAESNHALAYAARLANESDLPLLVYEGLTCMYPHASDRLHTFVLEGVPDTARQLRSVGVGFIFYLRRSRSDPNDILYRLASHARAVVTDDYPAFIARVYNARVPRRIDAPYIVVDSSCVVPMNSIEKLEYAAYTIRPKIAKLLPACLRPVEPLRMRRRFKGPLSAFHTEVTAENIADLVAGCEIDHSVRPAIGFRGGANAAQRRFRTFLEHRLRRYARDRNEPSANATSDLSPYLHFGHISALHIALQVKSYAEKNRLIADEFLEQLIVRRELAFNFARHAGEPASLDHLPEWALQTLRDHAADKRPQIYSLDELERAVTYDELWNAAQKELLLRGKIHGYYRMYWGKKIIEWSCSYEDALHAMVYLHDRYALDGRDPNTYANILWCFGLHDRPWPERPIFGKVRYMSLDGMRRKTDVAAYVKTIADLESRA
jgi:deoxyribodipyrimidine photo-lyase